MFKKMDSFKGHDLSRLPCVSVCVDGASVMMRTKTILSVCENGKQKYLGSYCLLQREEI